MFFVLTISLLPKIFCRRHCHYAAPLSSPRAKNSSNGGGVLFRRFCTLRHRGTPVDPPIVHRLERSALDSPHRRPRI
ncbi:hypothetical protein BGW80DRAFT_1353508 [Lactifluus volemus]|nr:hypothetical protein BGW80DRAFT_1353508 [Lactifluus volemus]